MYGVMPSIGVFWTLKNPNHDKVDQLLLPSGNSIQNTNTHLNSLTPS